MSIAPVVEDPFEIFKYVKAIMGYPVVEIEITDEQLNLFLKNSLETYSRVIPYIKWYSIPAFPGVQEYILDKGDIGNGIVDVMIPRIDPIAPLMLCLDGETKITLLDGRSRSILELQEEYGSGEFWVYSASPDGSIHPGRAHSIRQTGSGAETVEVEISNGEKVYCTPEHRWMLRDGTYREAKDLQPGDSLMPLYRQSSSLTEDKNSKGLIKKRVLKQVKAILSKIQGPITEESYNAARDKYMDEKGLKVRNAPKYERALEVMGDLAGANHTIVLVKPAAKRDVYDLTVDEYHNFALDCGVFVHNSSGPRMDIFGYRYCLTKDTSISLLDGRERTIEQLYEEYGTGVFWVYSNDGEGNIRAGRAHSIHLTGKDEGVVRVTLDNGESVTCTPGHQFMLRDGTYKPAGELQPGESLMPLYRRVSTDAFMPGYELAHAGKPSTEQYTHRLVADGFKLGKCEICESDIENNRHGIRHHKNFNKRDNSPDNLQWVTHEEHTYIHRANMERLWQDEDFRRKVTELSRQRLTDRWINDLDFRQSQSDRMKAQWEDEDYRQEKIEQIKDRHQSDEAFKAKRDEAASNTLKKLWADPDLVERKADQQSKMMKDRWSDEEFRNTTGAKILAALEELREDPVMIAAISARMAEYNAERWQDPEFRAKMVELARENINRLWEDPDFRENVTESSRARMTELWQDPEFRDRRSKEQAETWQDPECRAKTTEAIRQGSLRRWGDPEQRANASKRSKKVWADGDLRKSVGKRAVNRWKDAEFKKQAKEKMAAGWAKRNHKKNNHAGDFEGCGACAAYMSKKAAERQAKELKAQTNHKVVSVEPAGRADVYDLSVDRYNNFALSCGVNIKNSYPYRDISELYIDYMYFTEATKILSSDFQWDYRDGKLLITPKPDEPFSLSFAAAHPRDMSSIPASDIDWVRMHVLAQTEIAVGRVRRKYRIPGSHSEQLLDGSVMVQEGLQRLLAMEAELMKRTPDFGPMRTN